VDKVLITTRPLSLEASRSAVTRPDCGGLCFFLGTVRNTNEGKRVTRISYTAFRDMALKTFRKIAAESRAKFGARAVYIAHRTGMLRPPDASVLIAVAAPHRAEAFAACRHAIERLKKISPIWKEEFTARGKAWVNRG